MLLARWHGRLLVYEGAFAHRNGLLSCLSSGVVCSKGSQSISFARIVHIQLP